MQVILKQEVQHHQVKTVLSSIADTTSFLTVSAKDKDVGLNRSLFLVFSPLLRSILGSISSSDRSSASLIISSVKSRSLLNLQKLLLAGSLDNLLLDRVDIEEIVDAGLLLGVRLTNLLRDFENVNPEHQDVEPYQHTNLPADSTVFMNEVVNGRGVNHVHTPTAAQTAGPEDSQQMIQIKVEPDEYREVEESSPSAFLVGTFKEESTCIDNEVQQQNIFKDLSCERDLANSRDREAMLTEEEIGEEGEIRDSLEIDLLVEETLHIEPNEKEIEELLNATKTEIEKFLVVRKPTEVSRSIDEDVSTPGIYVENGESSTSLKTSATLAERNTVSEESSNYRYPCNLCVYKTNVGLNIKKHMKSIHKCFYTFKCHKCRFESASEQNFKLHSCDAPSEAGLEAKFQCTLCSFKTHMPDFIQVHMKNNHDSYFIFKCSRCEYETSRYHKLSNHECSPLSSSRPEPSSRGVTCASNLCMRCGRYHATPCNRPVDCVCEEPGCGKIGHSKSLHYPSTIALYKAIQLNDSSISLEMPLSGQGKNVALKKSKGALYPCKDCAYKTNKASMIKYHAKKTHQSQYLFSCTICLFSTTDNNMFPSHRCKEEMIKCPQCDFTSNKMLLIKRHISTQHESQVYACGQCAYKCTTLDSFKKHQLLFCKGNTDELNQTTADEKELFLCDRCDYEGRDIHGLRKHKTTVHANVASRRQRSRGDMSPRGRSRTPLRRADTFSPVVRSPLGRVRNPSRSDRSLSRQRNPSNRSQTSSRGPTTPFPPPAVLYLEPARAEDMYPASSSRAPGRGITSSRALPSRRRPEAKGRHVLLCLRCGRRHAAECKHPADSWCSQPMCGKTGHVVSLHHPKNMNDYKLIKAKVPGVAVTEPRK